MKASEALVTTPLLLAPATPLKPKISECLRFVGCLLTQTFKLYVYKKYVRANELKTVRICAVTVAKRQNAFLK